MKYNSCKIILFITVIFMHQNTQSQLVDSALGFFPMSIGNEWLYDRLFLWPTPHHILYMNVSIIGDTVLHGGVKYFTFFQQSTYDTITLNFFRRIDSTTANVYQCYSDSDQERLVYILRSQPGDTVEGVQCLYSGPDSVLGTATTIKSFQVGQVETYNLAYGIGLQTEYDEDMFTAMYENQLIYARVNGKAYGSQTDVRSTSVQPHKFGLLQNYPNPFNPSTTISFDLPTKSLISLKVYDIIGREVATIVSEEMSAGNYSRQWNASGMPSGVYFYRLQAGSFIETKKLVLLR